jgi:hypothetical protein
MSEATSAETAATINGAEATTPAAPASSIARRVDALRRLSETDHESARDLCWALFKELGARAPLDADAAAALDELFHLGTPPERVDGQTEGILVAFVWRRPVNVALRAITGAWMPWLGKRFDAGERRGDNVLLTSARWPSKLVWPLYRTREAEGGLAAFDFETAVEPSKDDPSMEALKIDYHDVAANPKLLIRSIRDELVEIVPGAYLGKMLWRHDADRHTLLAYFALREPAALYE